MNDENITTSTEATEATTVGTDDKGAEGAKTPDTDSLWKEINSLKKRLSEVNSEAAAYKKDNATLKGQLKAKMTEDERKEAERAEKEAAREAELAELRREKTVNGYKARLMEVGYDADTAKTMAEGLPSDLGDDFFAAQKTFLDNKAKEIEANLIKNQPNLSNGKPFTASDAEAKELADLRRAFGLS